MVITSVIGYGSPSQFSLSETVAVIFKALKKILTCY